MDRVARVGRQDDVAGAGDGLGEVGQPLLGAERDDGLALRVQLDAEAARVVGAERAAQAGDAGRGRVAVRARIGPGPPQLDEDVLRGGAEGGRGGKECGSTGEVWWARDN